MLFRSQAEGAISLTLPSATPFHLKTLDLQLQSPTIFPPELLAFFVLASQERLSRLALRSDSWGPQAAEELGDVLRSFKPAAGGNFGPSASTSSTFTRFLQYTPSSRLRLD